MAYVPSGDNSNDAAFFMRQANYGLCSGGFPHAVFDFVAQYGSATCDAETCTRGCYPYTGEDTQVDTDQVGRGGSTRRRRSANYYTSVLAQSGGEGAHHQTQKYCSATTPCAEGFEGDTKCARAKEHSAVCLTVGQWHDSTEARMQNEILHHGSVAATMEVLPRTVLCLS